MNHWNVWVLFYLFVWIFVELDKHKCHIWGLYQEIYVVVIERKKYTISILWNTKWALGNILSEPGNHIYWGLFHLQRIFTHKNTYTYTMGLFCSHFSQEGPINLIPSLRCYTSNAFSKVTHDDHLPCNIYIDISGHRANIWPL